MEQSILDLLKPIADAVGVSMVWVNATAVNVLMGTGLVKKAFGIRGNWNLATAGVIALAMGFSNYYTVPITAAIGAALVFCATALAFKLTGEVGTYVRGGLKPPETRVG